MKSEEQDRIDAAFLAAGIDPEFSAVIHEYHHNVYVHALVHTLAKYMEHVQKLEHEKWRRDDYLRWKI